jgi:hypothetical protein
MTDYTNKVGAPLMGGGLAGDVEPPEKADISKINDGFRKLDAALGFQMVTTATRPASPFDGQPWFERDSGKGYIRDAATNTDTKIVDANLLSGFTGTSALRDVYYGIPGTTSSDVDKAARVALASKLPIWRNTEKGYEEQYFAKADDPGVLAGTSAFTPGWYPSGGGVVPWAGVDLIPGSSVVFGGPGFTVITTNSNWLQESSKPIGGASYGKIDGTAPGLRLIGGIDGWWRVRAQLTATVGNFNLVVKRSSVSADYGNAVAVQSSGQGVSGTAGVSLDKEVRMNATDFLTFVIHSSFAGNGTIAPSYEENVTFSIEWIRPRTR